MTKRINVILPQQTLSVLDRVTTRGNRSHFITRAVHFYVESQGKQNLRDQLKAGYLANADRDLEHAVEWFPLEEEAHRTLEHFRTQKTTRTPNANDPSNKRPNLSCSF